MSEHSEKELTLGQKVIVLALLTFASWGALIGIGWLVIQFVDWIAG